MKESVAIAKEADVKKGVSPTKSDNSTHRARNEPERQLGSLRDVIGNIRRDGSKPSVESIATQLSGMPTGERAPVLLALQQTHGNRYVQRVVAGIQAKLKVGQPGDIYEQEADRVAEQVVRMVEPSGSRQVNELLQTKLPSDQDIEVAPDIEARINFLRGGGQPLPESVRAFFEPRFGYDFSQVRVHTDTRAADTARALNARAFTVRQDVVFGTGEYAPGTASGKRLLAHELTHVVQQNAGSKLTRAPILIQRVEHDAQGRRLHSSGTWNSNTTLNVQGGQGMHFWIKNINVLGTTISITDSMGQSRASLILPQGTVDFVFTCFGAEPMSWRFDIRSESDAFMVIWKLYSTWIPGDPPNR